MRIHYICCLICLYCSTQAQSVLQLEMINQPQVKKYWEGSELTFKIKGSDDWLERRIESIMITDSALVFNEGFFKLKDITSIQTKRIEIAVLSGSLQSFGAGWLGFAAIDEISRKGQQTTTKTWVIGSTAFITGWALRKLFYKRTHPLGSRYRLRMLDLSVQGYY